MFVTEQSLRYKVDEGNVITIGLDTQTVFYQPTSFIQGRIYKLSDIQSWTDIMRCF